MNELDLLYESRLTQIRIARVSGSRPKNLVKEGTLETTTSFGLAANDSEPRKRMAKLVLKVRGFPANADESSEPAFTIEVEVRGLVDFGGEASMASLVTEKRLTAVICQPLHVYASQKAEELLADMGVQNLKLDPDLRTVGDDANTTTASDPKRVPPIAVANEKVVADGKQVRKSAPARTVKKKPAVKPAHGKI